MAFQQADHCAISSPRLLTSLTVRQMQTKTRIKTFCALAALTRPIAAFVAAPQRRFFVVTDWMAAGARSGKRTPKFMTTTDDDDPLKWERMYQQKSPSEAIFEESPDNSATVRSQIRVVTFDLDDTLWKTGATISAANDILSEHLNSMGIQQPKRTEHVMGELFHADKPRYAPVLREDATAPVLLTRLRKDAIAFVAAEYNNYTASKAAAVAESAFEVWKRGRHDAIAAHMAESVVMCLERLSRLRTTEGDKILIGAITDGNSEPSLVEDIGQYFDFCVNAEQVGVGKPDRQVYARAVQQVRSLWRESASAATEELIDPDTSMVGPWWVHVGDDFLKDIVAAKDFGMRSIWSRELVRKLTVTKTQKEEIAVTPNKSLIDFDAEISSKKVVRMQIGADDYLAYSLEKEFADGVVERFKDILDLLLEWHEEGLANYDANAHHLVEETPVLPMIDEPSGQVSVVSATSPDLNLAEPPVATTRFCMFCGEQLPVSAIFCSSCGKKQA